jgi:outer membrane protein assembly factor BamE (lipoprotein component of BamABCDE complex)
MAANQPGRKDVSILNPGTPRSLVMGKLGQPINSEKNNGIRTDYFNFQQGYSGGSKAVRAVGHGVMSVLTIGLWEVLGTPIEGVADGQQMTIEVKYDKEDNVTSAKIFADGDLVKVVDGNEVIEYEKPKKPNSNFKNFGKK